MQIDLTSVAASWAEYAQVLPLELPHRARADLREVFYAGATSLLTCLFRDPARLTPAGEAIIAPELVHALWLELQSHYCEQR